MARIVSGGRRGRRPDAYRKVRRAIRERAGGIWARSDWERVLHVRREVAAAARRWPTRAHLAERIGLVRAREA